jgi:hypothetical protein
MGDSCGVNCPSYRKLSNAKFAVFADLDLTGERQICNGDGRRSPSQIEILIP